ncbi:class I SAM-dependent methyltransferase [Sessilibacter corallicola]|uniref:class I SAM-dependent methyltransferase n=1 Tax=Sessilibacter corallicola TaxID=2904075 RepID=UPI001E2AC483|nr:class I SAM-dependent methyltransferase [Sessilibacter corallicola]MCE2029209.1 class I SAM-dependent methyltransferase [Sessilibacter corallicola]
MSDKHFFAQSTSILPDFMRQWLERWFGVSDIEELAPALEEWLESPLGSSLMRAEQEMLDTALSYLFGYHLMQLSPDRRAKLYGDSKINHCFGLHPLATDGKVYTAMSEFEHLPIADESIDVVLLHHILEFSKDPHRLLREASRVTTPHGYMVVIGFNPYSILGVYRQLARVFIRDPKVKSHAIRISRVTDWLRLLDFTPLKLQRGFFRLPVNNRFFLRHTEWFDKLGSPIMTPIGGFYMIIARKQIAPITPIKQNWSLGRAVPGFSVGKSASRFPESARVTAKK